ncbi:MAG: carbonic anhydrase [Solirubrobacteraceae bacterium]
MTAQQALDILMEGNRRWVDGRLAHPNRSVERRQGLADAQRPFATVFSCIDSRVPPEIVFDCGIGDLAVIRTGAHVLDDDVVMASLQFAAGVLQTPLMLVLGHQGCGAVTAAIDALEGRASADATLSPIVDALRPAHDTLPPAPESANAEDRIDRMVKAQTQLTVRAVAQAPMIAARVRGGDLQIVGGYYSFHTGAVSILD